MRLLAGDPTDVPDLSALRLAIDAAKPKGVVSQQVSSLEAWREHIEALMDDGASPKAIYDRRRLDHKSSDGSLSALKRVLLPRTLLSPSILRPAR